METTTSNIERQVTQAVVGLERAFPDQLQSSPTMLYLFTDQGKAGFTAITNWLCDAYGQPFVDAARIEMDDWLGVVFRPTGLPVAVVPMPDEVVAGTFVENGEGQCPTGCCTMPGRLVTTILRDGEQWTIVYNETGFLYDSAGPL